MQKHLVMTDIELANDTAALGQIISPQNSQYMRTQSRQGGQRNVQTTSGQLQLLSPSNASKQNPLAASQYAAYQSNVISPNNGRTQQMPQASQAQIGSKAY